MNLLRKLTNVAVEKLLTVKKLGKLEFETGAQIRVRAPNGGAVTATVDMTELGTLDGLTATAAELNRATDISARVVTTTATVLALTVTQHADRVVLVNSNSTVANTLTLPVATGSGAKFTVINNIAQTQGSVVVAANGTLDVMKGVAVVSNTSTTVNVQSFLTSASSDKVTWNRTTSGGAGPGDYFEAWDSAANTWTVQVRAGSVGNAATPFSET
jgi:hypothetical protein